MKDNIEQYFKENRQVFDHLVPHPDHWQKLEQKLNSKKNILNLIKQGWKIAAVLVVGIGLSYLYLQLFTANPVYGKTFPEITLPTPDGKNISISSLKGKVVLVAFWASWCRTCKDLNCNEFLPLYNQYNAQGFDIYSISIDTDKNQWINGIKRDNLPWINVSDLQGVESSIAQNCQVQAEGIPSTFLLDRKGRLIAKNLKGQELQDKLKYLLSSELLSCR